MKVFLKLMVVTILTSTTGLATSASPPQSEPNSIASVQTVSQQDSSIAVFLPGGTDVRLKDGTSMSGKLTEIDHQTQQIKLELSGESATVAIADIEKIKFEGEVLLRSGGKIVIRGDRDQTSPNKNQKTWNEPLNNFRIIDSSKGEAQINLTSVTNKFDLKGIRAVAASSSYVAEEIQFDSTEMIILKVTPR